jgi:hypothetical protein
MKIILALTSSAGLLIYPVSQAGAPQAAMAIAPNSEQLAPMVLNGYSRFPRNIGSANVYDLDGHRVGLVKALDADPTGKPAAMEIWLPSGRSVTVEASNLSYDEQQNTITAGLTDAQFGVSQAPDPAIEQK